MDDVIDRRKLGIAVIMMGVSGAGKTTIGEQISKELQCSFFDADDFHSEANKEKMRSAIPLKDEDRQPWLEALRDLLWSHISAGQWVVLACSALKRKYRDILRTADPTTADQIPTDFGAEADFKTPATSNVLFVYLRGSYELFVSRLETRYNEGTHYMPPSLLHSQVSALEIQDNESGVISVDASMPPAMIVNEVLRRMRDSNVYTRD